MICERPEVSTIFPGEVPVANISSNTVFAVVEFRVPPSSNIRSSINCLGRILTSAISPPVELSSRVSSPRIQLLADFAICRLASPDSSDAAITDSK